MKRLRVIIGFLLAGAVVNVGVTWGLAWQYPYKTTSGPVVAQVIHVQRGWTMAISDLTGRTFMTGLAIHDAPRTRDPSIPEPPYWSWTFHVMPPSDHSIFDEAAYGYPFRSLSYVHIRTGDGRDDVTGIPLVTPGTTRYLPTHVIWTGSALNTAAYGAIFLACMMVRLTVLGVIRHLRGRCLSCGYDLRGADHLQCPECGTRVRKVRRARNAFDSH